MLAACLVVLQQLLQLHGRLRLLLLACLKSLAPATHHMQACTHGDVVLSVCGHARA
jgi:hypothetical protein